MVIMADVLESSASAATGGASWLSVAAPIAGAALQAVGQVGSGLFAANQARKNRKFQERMYYQQLEDNRENWRLQNEYNLPVNQLQRLTDAGLNPLLMYGQGGVSNTVSSPSQGASAPHGAQGDMNLNTNFGQALAQAAMMQAQIRNLNASSEQMETTAEKNRVESHGIAIQNEIAERTKEISVAMKYNDFDKVSADIRYLNSQILNNNQLTNQQVLTYIQAREYEIKRYQLSEWQAGEQIKQGWANVRTGQVQANAAFKQAVAALENAASTAKLTDAEVGRIGLLMTQSREMFPLLKNNQQWTNMDAAVRTLLDLADIPAHKADAFTKTLEANRNAFMPNAQSQLGKTVRDIGIYILGPWNVDVPTPYKP